MTRTIMGSDDPGEFGVGADIGPGGRYWRERSVIWRERAIASGWTAAGGVTANQCVELAAALEQLRALKIVEAVVALPIAGADADMPTEYQAGFLMACEEIEYRLRTEQWTGCLPPVGLKTRRDAQTSPLTDA